MRSPRAQAGRPGLHPVAPRFDAYRASYREEVQRSISFMRQDVEFFAAVKARYLLDAARHLGDSERLRVLNVGCGIGIIDRLLTPCVAALEGIDVASELVAEAATANPSATYRSYDGTSLPYQDRTFDLSFTANVLHHVPAESWETFLAEMGRVTRRGGLLVVFEQNPFNPLTRLAVSRCSFDDGCALLSRGTVTEMLPRTGFPIVASRYILTFPWPGGAFARIEGWLGSLPLGAQYLVVAKVP